MQIDVCMWTKNGEKWLTPVLRRIDEVIPSENINQKILVDDHSVDRTVEIAKDFNWKVYENPSTGISAGANEALRHVKTDIFASFEQDLFLAENWFDLVNRCFDDRVPEEINRRIIDHTSDILLPYTHRSKENLIRGADYRTM